MSNLKISCRAQAVRVGSRYGLFLQRHLNLALGREELATAASASADGHGLEASAVPRRWGPVYVRAFVRQGLAMKRRGKRS